MRNKEKILITTVIIIVVIATLLYFTGCTENTRARKFGGSATVELPIKQKLITATWKNNNLWLLTREMKADEAPETYKFFEKSSWGQWEGTYIIKEKK